MIEVTVYFWAESADERVVVLPMGDNTTILDLKNTLIDPSVDTPFNGYYDVTAFGIADYPAGDSPVGLPDSHALVDNQSYEARME